MVESKGAWGTIWHVNVDGKAVLRLAEDFRAVNGSALEVILIESAEPGRQEIAGGYKLADLKALEGMQDCEIPIPPSPLTQFANLGNDGSGYPHRLRRNEAGSRKGRFYK